MNALAHEIAERRVNHALSFDAVLSGKGRAFDEQGEVALARGVVAAVAAVLLAIVDQFDGGRGKRRVEPAEHLSCDGSDGLGVHGTYIAGFDGDEAIQDAR